MGALASKPRCDDSKLSQANDPEALGTIPAHPQNQHHASRETQMAYFTWKEAGLTADCASLAAMAARFEEAAALMRRMASEGFVLERHADGQHITHTDSSVFAAYGFIDEQSPVRQLSLID
jgi:hypothetical protein